MTLNNIQPKPITSNIVILLAVCNGIKWLPVQLKSILDQSFVKLDIYISVDVSTDGSLEWLIGESENDSRIHILPYGQKYGCASINFYRLLRDTDIHDFQFIAFSDQDDIWFINKLNRAINIMETFGYDGYSSDVIAFWDSGKIKYLKKSNSQRLFDYLFEGAGPGCSIVMTYDLAHSLKQAILNNWYIANEIDWHDWLAYAFARANDFPWYIDNKPSLLYRQHSSNQIGMNNGIKAFFKRANNIINGYGFSQSQKIARVTGAWENKTVRRYLSGTRCSIVSLMLRPHHFRRSLRDRFLFILACLAMILCVNSSSLKDLNKQRW